MTPDTPPYDTIDETGDRSWTLRLVERLTMPDLSEDERYQIEWVVERLFDPRAVEPLTRLLEDRNQPRMIRETAASILRSRNANQQQCLDYWHSDDEVLREYALWQMDESHAEITDRIATDPHHPMHRIAIAKLIFRGEQSHHQARVVNALKHPDPAVRGTAAIALLWSESNIGELPLIEATADPDLDVVDDAIAALKYYPTQRVLLRIRELSTDHPEEAVRKAAAEVYTEMRDDFADYVRDSTTREHFTRWLAPIWDVLAYTPDELKEEEDTPYIRPAESRQAISRVDVETVIDNPDSPLQTLHDLFWHSDWQSIPVSDQMILIERFVQHYDLTIRELSGRVLAVWNAHDALLMLIRDPEFGVRKSAMYWLGETTPRADIAPMIWQHLQGPLVNGMHAQETLKTYSKHAARSEATGGLFALADEPTHLEDLRYQAIYILNKWAALPELTRLMRHLSDPPAVTWTVHTALLDAAAAHHLPTPDLTPLLAVDNLWVQVALAPLMPR
jgi:hypothetical protein